MYSIILQLLYVAFWIFFVFLVKELGVLGLTVFWSAIMSVGQFCSGRYYEGSEEYNSSNPLFAKGLFRKKAGRGHWARLKGLFYCQIVIFMLDVFVFVYLGYIILGNAQRNFYLEKILIICYIPICFVCFCLNMYYTRCYTTSYRYSQNKNGIWTPFSFVFRDFRGSVLNAFSCNYHVKFDKIVETLRVSCKENGYHFSERYETDDGTELSFFTRHTSNRLDIFSLVHVKKLETDSWDKFNEFFEEYWKTFVEKRFQFDEARFTFLLCIDDRCKQLRKIGMRYAIDQKKGRYRLPAVLSYYYNDTLTINSNRSRMRGQEEYNEMRKELLSMLHISEHYNNRIYPREFQE